MKRCIQYYMVCVGLLSVTSLQAQDTSNDSIKTPARKDPLYLQVYGGINKSANENLPFSEFTSYPWSGGLFVGLGKEFTPRWGWRAAFRFNHNKSRNTQVCESSDVWGWNNLGLFVDLTLDLTDVFRRGLYQPQKVRSTRDKRDYPKWNTKLFAGVGGAYTFAFDEVPLSYQYKYNRNSQFLLGTRVGLTTTYQVAENWRIGAELSQNIYQDNFNGVKAEMPIDGRTNLKIGVTYLLTKTKKIKEPPTVIYDNRLRAVPDLPFVLPAIEREKVRHLSGRAFLDFVVDRTEIKPNYRRNSEELDRIIATVDSALFDKSVEVRKITLHGYASPESPYSHNEDLSKGRVAALRDYLQKHYKFNPMVFELHNTPEDWKNLRDFIELGDRRRVKDDIWYESKNIEETPETPAVVLNNREELLRVIDLDMDPDEKETLLKQVGGGEPYKWLLKYVYPGLRHTDYIIEYVVRQYPVKEGRKLIYTHPEALSLNEMYQVANSYLDGSDEWLDALLMAAKQYSDDPTANLNAACACVTVKRLADAKRYLARAGNSEEAHYVRRVIQAMEGSIDWTLKDGKVIEK